MTTKPNPSCLHCRIHETIRQFREDVAKSGQDLPLDTAAALQSLAAVMGDIIEAEKTDKMRVAMPHVLSILGSALPDNITSGSLTLMSDDGKVGEFDFDETGDEERPEVLQ